MNISFSSAACVATILLSTLVAPASTFVVSNLDNSGAGSLRQAILDANAAPGPDVITFSLGNANPRTIELLTALPSLTGELEIANDGPSDEVVTVLRNSSTLFGIFHVAVGNTVVLAGLRVENGNVAGGFPVTSGGGIWNDHATLTVRHCVITGNRASLGAGIFNDGNSSGLATLTLSDSVLDGNLATAGGAVASDGSGTDGHATMIARRCTFSGNGGPIGGGAIFNDGRNGGNAEVELVDSTFSSNTSSGGVGGAIFSTGGTANVSLLNCTLAGNTSNSAGGAIYIEGFSLGASVVTLKNCTVSENSAVLEPSTISNGGTLKLANTILRRTSGQNISGNGIVTSLGHNLSNDAAGGDGTTGPGGFLNAAGDIRNTDPLLAPVGPTDNGGPTHTIALQGGSPAINMGDDTLAPPQDQRGLYRAGVSDIGAFEFAGAAAPSPATLANISTRLAVQAGDNVLIGGFIVTGTQPKKVIVRALGPSLNVTGVPLPGRLGDTTLELVGPSGTIATNDNWRIGGQEAEIIASTVPPPNDFESAIVATLPANASAYTAIVRGAGNTTGVGQVEIYDLDRTVDSQLANISTRGLVQTGDNVMIGGIILVGSNPRRVIVRAIGPSLNVNGTPVPGRLLDTTLDLADQNGMILATNDDWRSTQEAEIIATTVPPTDNRESAIVATLPAAAYTAIVRGKNATAGVALVEVFALP